jgi:hypothetical protein
MPVDVANEARTGRESATVATALFVVPKSRPTLPFCTNLCADPTANGCVILLRVIEDV